MDGSGPRSELQELQIKAQQATDEVRESLQTRLCVYNRILGTTCRIMSQVTPRMNRKVYFGESMCEESRIPKICSSDIGAKAMTVLR